MVNQIKSLKSHNPKRERERERKSLTIL